MNMKLSYRDKVIFIVVIIIIILVAGFFLFIQPKFKDVESAKNNLEAKKQERVDLEAKIATLPTIIDDIKAAADEIGEKQEIFMTEQDPYLNEIYIREALASERLEVRSINTTYTTAGAIDWYSVSPAHILAYDNKMSADLYNELPQEVYDAYNNVPPEVYPNTIIGVTTVNVTLDGGTDPIEQANRAIDRIAEDEKTIILNTIATEVKETAGEGEGEDNTVTVTMTLYSVFPLNVEQVKQESTDIQPIEPAAAEEEPVA